MKKYSAYIIISLVYYLMPAWLIQDTGSGMSVLLFVIPLLVLVISGLFAGQHGFSWHHGMIMGALWLPNIFLLNDTAAIYSLIYGVISLIGQFIGAAIRRSR